MRLHLLDLHEGHVRVARLRLLLALRRLGGLHHQRLLHLLVHGLIIPLGVVQPAVAQNVGQRVADVGHAHNVVLRPVSLPDTHLRLQRFAQNHCLFFVLVRADAHVHHQIRVGRPRPRIDRHKLTVDAHHFLTADVLLGQPDDDLERLLEAAFGQVARNEF